jgi:hypothetical protein
LLVGTETVTKVDTVAIGFPMQDGRPATHFPSIEATLDGETRAFLFDTGATIRLNEDAHRRLGGPAERATSFLVASWFDRLRTGHPDWTVVEHADANVGDEPMIEVPSVTIAGFEVGPVWFTRRADRNFHRPQGMSRWMDRQVDGALGGSLLQYFVVTVDYPRATATFSRA